MDKVVNSILTMSLTWRHQLLAVVLLVTMVGICPAVNAQNSALEKRISINFNQEPLHLALSAISKVAQVNLSYNSELLPNREVTASIENESVLSILTLLVDDNHMQFKETADHIIFLKSDKNYKNQLYTLSGRIINQDTNAGVNNASVFISNSTIGATSDAKGYFQLNNIPYGEFDIVISHVSYHPAFLTKHTSLLNAVQIKLKPKVVQLEELKIGAKPDKKWNQKLAFFKSILLGNTFNSTKCEILNPWVLEFQENENQTVFVAKSNDILIIENKALGYIVKTQLLEFVVANGEQRYRCKSLYEALEPENDRQAKRWKLARKKAYNGSIDHFMTYLLSDNPNSKDFEISLVSDRSGNPTIRRRYIDKSEMITQDSISKEKVIRFDSYLEIKYLRGIESKRYYESIYQNEADSDYRLNALATPNSNLQTSWLKLDNPKKPVPLNVRKLNLILEYGYWAWKRLADDLPIDYSID
jgi:hypothetical protein